MFSYVAMEKRKKGGRVETGKGEKGEKGSGRKEEGKRGMQMETENENENEKNSETMSQSHSKAENLAHSEVEKPQHPIAENPQHPTTENPAHPTTENPAHPTTENPTPRSTSTPEEKEAKTWRVLQTPIKRDQHVLVDVCSPEGTLERRIFSKRKMKDDLEKYRLIRKAEWGGDLSLCLVWFQQTQHPFPRIGEFIPRLPAPQQHTAPSQTRRYRPGTYGYPCCAPTRTGGSERLFVIPSA